MGLFSGAGGAGTPIGGLLALVGSSLLMQGGTTNATIMLLLFAILALGNLLLLALPAVPHTPTPPRSDAVQEPETAPGFEIPQLLASSRQARLLMVCTMSSGYANAFMSGSFTLEVVVCSRVALVACSFRGRDWSHGCCTATEPQPFLPLCAADCPAVGRAPPSAPSGSASSSPHGTSPACSPVSRHDTAAIWVAFFSRCQRYRCQQALRSDGSRTTSAGSDATSSR